MTAGVPGGRVLLVGNSRWHWGERARDGSLRCWDVPAAEAQVDPGPLQDLRAWSAVGMEPAAGLLPLPVRFGVAAVPLGAAPTWLGVDRALAGWGAHRRAGGAAVLVADAGTCLSLTRVGGDGQFVGGRLSAGLALQLNALAAATAALPALAPPWPPARALPCWPQATDEALLRGAMEAVAAAIAAAGRELLATDPGAQLWLTGGDGTQLAPLLLQQGLAVRLCPHLCLETLAELAGL